jgi:hypothetical protein
MMGTKYWPLFLAFFDVYLSACPLLEFGCSWHLVLEVKGWDRAGLQFEACLAKMMNK